METMIRLKKFLIALNEYFDTYSYYDEELDDTIIDGDENDCYRVLMKNEEFHLLGRDCAKQWIHTAYTDWELFTKMCHTIKVYY